MAYFENRGDYWALPDNEKKEHFTGVSGYGNRQSKAEMGLDYLCYAVRSTI
jgi:hypothetical protein